MNGMELDTYQHVANAFDVSPGEPWYYALGLGGEAGETLEVIKKSYRIDAPPINVEALALELGDVLWYLAGLARQYGLKLSTVAEMNIQKLEKPAREARLPGEGGDPMTEIMRTFETGATRSSDVGKHDFEGYLSPLVLEAFAEYMTSHRIQADGKTRDSDNWQKGMGMNAPMKSAWRHFFDWWKCHRGYGASVDKTTGKQMTIDDALCGLLFNVNVYYHQLLLERRAAKPKLGDRREPPADADVTEPVQIGRLTHMLPTPEEVLRRIRQIDTDRQGG